MRFSCNFAQVWFTPVSTAPAGGHFQRVGVPAGVGDVRYGVRQVIHRAADGRVVIHSPGADQPPRAGKPVLKRAGHRVGGGGRQVLPGAAGLAVPGVQQVQQGRGLVDRRRVQPGSRINGIVRGQGLCPGGFQQPLDLRPAFAGVLRQRGNGVAAHGAGFASRHACHMAVGVSGSSSSIFLMRRAMSCKSRLHLLPQLHKRRAGHPAGQGSAWGITSRGKGQGFVGVVLGAGFSRDLGGFLLAVASNSVR